MTCWHFDDFSKIWIQKSRVTKTVHSRKFDILYPAGPPIRRSNIVRIGERGRDLEEKFKPGAIIRDRKIDVVKYVPIDRKWSETSRKHVSPTCNTRPDLENFNTWRVDILTIFRKFDSKKLELQKLFTRENLIFYTQWGPLSGGQISSEYVCTKILGHPPKLTEIGDFQRLACSGPPSGGTATPTIKIFHGPVEGHTVYSNCVFVTTTRATFRNYGTPNIE